MTTPPAITSALLLLLLSLAAIAPDSAAAQEDRPIVAIELVGLERLSPGAVEARMKLKVGAPYRARELDAEYQRLWKSGDFLFIEQPQVLNEGDGVRIIITFVEKERVARIRIKGDDELGEGKIKEVLRTRTDGLLNPFDLERDREDILRLYNRKGFLFSRVETESRRGQEGSVVTFRIYEGPRVTIREIRFSGADSFSAGELRKQMETKERSYFFGMPHSGVFDREIYQQDIRALQGFYRRKGFFDAVVASEELRFNEGRDRLDLVIRVQEGERYRLRAVEFDIVGDGLFPQSRLREEIEIREGAPWDGETIEADALRLGKLYAGKSYVNVDVKPQAEFGLSGDDVTLRFRIVEGEQVFIEDVEIRGNAETRDRVIRRQLTFYPGEEIDIEEFADSHSNLTRLKYFDRVGIYFEAGSLPSLKTIVVDVNEAPTGRLLFGFGVTSGRGAVGSFSLTKHNFDISDLPESFIDIPNAFTGGGQTLILEAQPGTDFSRYRLDFLEPYLFDSPISLNLRGYKLTNLREKYQDDRTAGEIAIGRRLLEEERLRAEIGYRFELVDIHNIELDASPEVFRAEGSTRVSALRFTLGYDQTTFRRIVGPVDGWNVSATYEYTGGPLGAELDLSKVNAWAALHRTVFSRGEARRHILSWKNSISWAEPHHNTGEVPIYERFYLGGSRSLRGFDYRRVGPHFGNEPIGGAVRHFGTLEYTFPLADDIIRGVGFIDYGNLSPTLQAFHGGDYRLSVGGGILINVPFLGQHLPMSFTWGDALLSEDGDKERQFLFDIGFGF